MKKTCKLTYEQKSGEEELGEVNGEYVLYIGDMLATELPTAPPIILSDSSSVLKSESYEYISETMTRMTWLVYLRGEKVSFVAEYNWRT